MPICELCSCNVGCELVSCNHKSHNLERMVISVYDSSLHVCTTSCINGTFIATYIQW